MKKAPKTQKTPKAAKSQSSQSSGNPPSPKAVKFIRYEVEANPATVVESNVIRRVTATRGLRPRGPRALLIIFVRDTDQQEIETTLKSNFGVKGFLACFENGDQDRWQR